MGRMLSRDVLRAVAGALALAGAASGPAAAADMWDCYITFPVSTVPNVQGVQRILDGINQQTNGALTIRMHLGGSLPINTTNITNNPTSQMPV